MPPWPLVWALRKVALVPGLVITAAALGGAYGAFDMSRRIVGLVLPPPTKPRRKGTAALSTLAAGMGGAAFVAARETLFASRVPKS